MGLKHIPQIRSKDIDVLKKYSWPGNVRELQNIIERALILCKGDTLYFHNILPQLYEEVLPDEAEFFHAHPQPVNTLEETMKISIINALKQTHGRISGPSGAASLLGINASTLRNRMIKLGIENIYR